MSSTMKAIVLTGTCDADELSISDVPIPAIRPGWVLVKIVAFGLNRAEVITRKYEAGTENVPTPRIIGIEGVGEIVDPSDSHFSKGQRVVALMGGMGRSFDGSYAEYALLPEHIIFPVESTLDWIELAAIPETYYTAYVSLFESLQIESGDTVLVRGGTSAVGLAAIQLAKTVGCTVIATSRKESKLAILESQGADYPLVDDTTLEREIRTIAPKGIDKVMELIGPATLFQSMGFVRYHGIVCSTGILGNQYSIADFDPIKDIPHGVYLSSCYSNKPTNEAIQAIFNRVERYHLKPPIAAVFSLAQIAEAHKLMESNAANGKIIVLANEL